MDTDEATKIIAHRLEQVVDLLALIAMNTARNTSMTDATQVRALQAAAEIAERKP